jgi:hypothetical protein
MKKGKSAKLSGYRNYKVNYGTVDSKNLKSIYINIQTWAEPKIEIESPNRVVNNLSRSIKHSVLESINTNIFEDKFIVDLDLRSSGIQLNKKSFLNLECYLYLKELDNDFKSLEIKNSIKSISDEIIKSNFIKNEEFNFTLTKKQTYKV